MKRRHARLDRGRARVARGAGLSAACLLTPTAAHLAAGGGVPMHAGYLVAAALLGAACVALADRRRDAREIGVVMILSQPVFHVLLTMSGHEAASSSTSLVPAGPMVLAHVVAALGLTVVLAGAEAVLWSLAALSATVLLRRVRLLATLVVAGETPRPRPHPHPVLLPYLKYVVRTAPRRGPPQASFA